MACARDFQSPAVLTSCFANYSVIRYAGHCDGRKDTHRRVSSPGGMNRDRRRNPLIAQGFGAMDCARASERAPTFEAECPRSCSATE